MKKSVFLFAFLMSGMVQAATVGQVCSYIAAGNAFLGNDCLKGAAGKKIDEAAGDACLVIARSNYSTGSQCISVAAGKTFSEGATKICSYIGAANGFLGVECMKGISGKVYTNDEITVCMSSARSNYSLGAQCLTNSGRAASAAPRTCPNISETMQVIEIVRSKLVAKQFNGTESIVEIITESIKQAQEIGEAEAILGRLQNALKTCQ